MKRPSKFAVEHDRHEEVLARLDWQAEALEALAERVGATLPARPDRGKPWSRYVPPRKPRLAETGEPADD